MNGRSYKSGKDKDVELINPPRHRHIKELFDVVLIFEECQKESKGDAKKYITNYTHEDLLWMVFGVASVASLYLETDGTKTMHQGQSGSDVCEHFFSMIRYINSNPTMKQCIDGCSCVASRKSFGGNVFSLDNRANSGKTRAASTEYIAPIQTVNRRSKKQKTTDK